MKAVIIAGGSGTRLRPLTYNTPKPMVPLFGKPFLQYQIELLKRHGVNEIIINLHYLSGVIREYFGDGSELGVKIHYSLEEKPLGTAGAVKLAEEYFDDEPLVVFNGDILTDLDLSALLAAHRENKARATITMIRVSDPTSYGLIFTEEDGRVTRFVEKPSWDEATVDTVNAGIYVLDPSVFRYVPRNEAYSFERGLFPLLLQLNEKVFGHTTNAYWLDIGSPQKYLQAHTDILMDRVQVELPAERREGNVWVGQNVDIDPSAEIRGPVYLGDGAKVRKRARLREFTILGPGVTVDDKAVLEHVLVGEGSEIGEEAHLSKCIIGQRCRVGASAVLNSNSVLADESVIGRGTRLGH
ncbi:MAG TPA: NDP-sugar synthase [Oscillatoriaceae cyanobacterium]